MKIIFKLLIPCILGSCNYNEIELREKANSGDNRARIKLEELHQDKVEENEPELLKLAMRGNALAQFELGQFYLKLGRRPTWDKLSHRDLNTQNLISLGLHLLKLSAEQGNLDSILLLMHYYNPCSVWICMLTGVMWEVQKGDSTQYMYYLKKLEKIEKNNKIELKFFTLKRKK